jgi:hypothetical protein
LVIPSSDEQLKLVGNNFSMYRVVDMSRGILIINRIDQTTTWNILGNKNKLIYHLMEEIKYVLIVFVKKISAYCVPSIF